MIKPSRRIVCCVEKAQEDLVGIGRIAHNVIRQQKLSSLGIKICFHYRTC